MDEEVLEQLAAKLYQSYLDAIEREKSQGIERDHGYAEKQRRNRKAFKLFRKLARPCTINDYAKWLCGYVAKGGEVYDWEGEFDDEQTLASGDWQLAWFKMHKSGEIPAFFGTAAINVIVPEGIDATNSEFCGGHDSFGHNHVYFMDGYRVVGSVMGYREIMLRLPNLADVRRHDGRTTD